MALNFAAIESALQAWLVTGTGLTLAAVVPKKKKAPQLAMPYATFEIRSPPKRAGGPDELRWSNTGGSPPLGTEVTTTVAAQREMVVAVQCFTVATSGASMARQYLAQAETSLALPSVRDTLNAAGLVFVDIEMFSDFTEALGPVGQGRAQLDVRFRVVDSASETVGYIATVNPVGTYS